MSRIPPLSESQMSADSREILHHHVANHGRVTNMKRTLAYSPLALKILLEWYPLRDAVVEFLGERATLLFAHAISDQSDCLICSTFFRRLLIDSGEQPDRLAIDPREHVIVEFGRQLVRDSNSVDEQLFEQLSSQLSPDQIVSLTAFGGLMIATNLFNNALRVDLDEYLWSYKKERLSQSDRESPPRESQGDL